DRTRYIYRAPSTNRGLHPRLPTSPPPLLWYSVQNVYHTSSSLPEPVPVVLQAPQRRPASLPLLRCKASCVFRRPRPPGARTKARCAGVDYYDDYPTCLTHYYRTNTQTAKTAADAGVQSRQRSVGRPSIIRFFGLKVTARHTRPVRILRARPA
ncbi:hypothetical protein CALVIDRAFT_595099, partial [Calocera viscosa TUFC12733]